MHSILSIIRSFIKNHHLIIEMAKRDLMVINKGSLLGCLWLILAPLIQTGTYVIIVSYIFGTKLSLGVGPLDYSLYVLGGMIPWQIITRSLAEAPMQIRDRMELVKQVIYPIETIPLTSLLVSSITSFISFIIFISLSSITNNLSWGMLLFPLPLALLLIFVLGISWICSIVGIFLKDLREIITIIMGLIVYISPVIASPEMVGHDIWKIILLNPLSHIIICFRDTYYSTFHPFSWMIFTGLSLSSFLLGAWIINKTKLMINQYI